MEYKKSNNNEANWYLEGLLGTGKKWLIPINTFPFVIGRSKDCNLTLSSKEISREHAEILRLGTSLMIRDVGSTNGTFINNNRITQSTSIRNGDIIHFGNIEFRIITKNEIDSDEYTQKRPYKETQKNENFVEYHKLTMREKDVLFYLLEGLATKQIAKKLNISDGTAKNYVLSIFKKTNVHSRFELLTLYNKYTVE
jgi:DNA-binding CsgD family transcriptional regulator